MSNKEEIFPAEVWRNNVKNPSLLPKDIELPEGISPDLTRDEMLALYGITSFGVNVNDPRFINVESKWIKGDIFPVANGEFNVLLMDENYNLIGTIIVQDSALSQEIKIVFNSIS